MVEVWVVVAILGVATSIITPLVNRVVVQNELIRTQKETIALQGRTIDMMEITGKLQDKMLRALPPPAEGPVS